jgi:hypothetical protein
MWQGKLEDGSVVSQHFIHPNFTSFSNHSVPLLVEVATNMTIDGQEIMFTVRWDVFYMIDAFERHELDSITVLGLINIKNNFNIKCIITRQKQRLKFSQNLITLDMYVFDNFRKNLTR